MGKKLGFALLALTVFLGVSFVRSYFGFKSAESKTAPFTPHVSSYIDARDSGAFDGSPYLRGKIVTVDVKNGVVDDLTYSRLSQELRAASPAEVDTVVLIEWVKKEVGRYVDEKTGKETGKAYRGYAYVSVIDWQQRLLVDRQTFVGEAPLSAVMSDGNYSTMPAFDILKYLNKLPRR